MLYLITAYHIERLEGQDPENPSINSIWLHYNPEGVSGGGYGFYNVPNQLMRCK